MTKFLAFDIGCLECGESSQVLGVFNTEIEAEACCDKAHELQSLNWTGQHHFEVFPIEIEDVS